MLLRLRTDAQLTRNSPRAALPPIPLAATGQTTIVSKRILAAAAPGSSGVRFDLRVNLGKTPTELDTTVMQSSLLALTPQSSLFQNVAAAVASATSLSPSQYSAAVLPSSVGFVNSPFLSAAPAVAASSSSGGGNSSSTIIGVVLGVALVFFVAVWMWRSWAKHGKLPCFRDRGAEKRAALAAMADRNSGAAEGELTVRALASTVAALKAELAAKKALEIAERNAGSERDASLTVSPLAKARAEAAAESAVAAVEKRGAFAPTGTR